MKITSYTNNKETVFLDARFIPYVQLQISYVALLRNLRFSYAVVQLYLNAGPKVEYIIYFKCLQVLWRQSFCCLVIKTLRPHVSPSTNHVELKLCSILRCWSQLGLRSLSTHAQGLIRLFALALLSSQKASQWWLHKAVTSWANSMAYEGEFKFAALYLFGDSNIFLFMRKCELHTSKISFASNIMLKLFWQNKRIKFTSKTALLKLPALNLSGHWHKYICKTY